MSHSTTWNSSYEAIPANGDDASEGALRIRNLKRDIRERLELDHVMDESDDDGQHAQITFHAPRATPTNVTDKGFLYTKDVSGKAELHWLDEDGNEVQITAGGDLGVGFASGDELVWRGSSPPAGWSVQAIDQKAIKIVSGSPGADGGGVDFDTVFSASRAVSGTVAGHSLTVAELPSHSHGVYYRSVGDFALTDTKDVVHGASSSVNDGSTASATTGSGNSHNHGWSGSVNTNVRYREFNIIAKS